MDRRAFLKTIASTAVLSGLWSVSPAKVFPAQEKGSVLVIAHLDDEIIWFLPWLSQIDKIIIASLPVTASHLNILSKYSSQRKASWHFTRGVTSYQDYKERWLNPVTRKELITGLDYDRTLRDIIADPGVNEIFTHSPWGEYGHLHHRQVSETVRKLAAEHEKDVWCPGIMVSFPEGGWPHSIYETTFLPGLDQKTGYYNSAIFKQIRQYYLDEPVNQTHPINYWTWGAQDDFPRGCQKYFLMVDRGHDVTMDSSEILWLQQNIPVYGV